MLCRLIARTLALNVVFWQNKEFLEYTDNIRLFLFLSSLILPNLFTQSTYVCTCCKKATIFVSYDIIMVRLSDSDPGDIKCVGCPKDTEPVHFNTLLLFSYSECSFNELIAQFVVIVWRFMMEENN